MTLEQQVANLVTATTELTSVVNAELNSVRAENNSFKSSTLSEIDTRFNDFTSQFDQVKLKNSSFTLYVNPIAGSSTPTNPVNNESDSFNTIANAVNFLRGYYWTNGDAVIKLSSGTHLLSGTLYILHPCPIRIEGYSVPDVSGVAAIASQTTNANRLSSSATPGSNANLFDHLASIFQSHIAYVPDTVTAFTVNNSCFSLVNCLVYKQNKNGTATAVHCDSLGSMSIKNCAFMYFGLGLRVNSTILQLQSFVLSSAHDQQGIINYGGSILSGSAGDHAFYATGNGAIGLYNLDGVSKITSPCAYGNGSHGFSCAKGSFVVDNAKSTANGGNGFHCFWGELTSLSSISTNNGGYGYRADSGLIMAINSDITTTGNVSGKKFENNALNGYVIGVTV